MNLHKTNVRFRLTLWYSVTLFTLLVLYAGITILLTFMNLRRNLDRQLEKDYEVIEEMIEIAPVDSVRIDEDDDSFLSERWVEIWSPEGRLLYNSRPFSGRDLPVWTPAGKEIMEMTFSSLRTKHQVRLRSLTARANIEGHEFVVRLFRPEAPLYKEINRFLLLLLIALPLALVIAAFGGYWLAGRLLSPIDKMTEAARNISSTNLSERLPVDNPSDELGRLAITFNDLLERLRESFDRLQQFTYDAAHELRTPLTAIRSMGEVALQKSHDTGTYHEIIGSILEENNRLTNLVNSLLILSRADSGQFVLNREETDITRFTSQAIEIILPLAEEKKQTILFKQEKSVMIALDKTLFRQALLNLLDNAIKYSPPNSTITVALEIEEREVRVRVTDPGDPIPEALHEKIFERFYRLDKSRARELGGTGLGLSIARWAIEIQGGRITLTTGRDKGNTFTIHIPVP